MGITEADYLTICGPFNSLSEANLENWSGFCSFIMAVANLFLTETLQLIKNNTQICQSNWA